MIQYFSLLLILFCCTGCNLIMYIHDDDVHYHHEHEHHHHEHEHHEHEYHEVNNKDSVQTLKAIDLPDGKLIKPAISRETFASGIEGDWEFSLVWVEKAVYHSDEQIRKSANLIYELLHSSSEYSLEEKIVLIDKDLKNRWFSQINFDSSTTSALQESWQQLFDSLDILSAAHITTAQLRESWPAWKKFPTEPEDVFPHLTPQLKKTPTMADFDKKKRQVKLLLAAFRQISGIVPDMYPPLPKLAEDSTKDG